MPVVVQCSSCQTRFKLADDKIKTTGTKVRCTKCREVFTVYPVREEPAVQELVDLPKKAVSTDQQPTFVSTESLFPDHESALKEEANIPAPAAPPPVADAAWLEKDSGFTDSVAADSAASDIDAINFENMETPVFSVATEESSEPAFDFTETFNDSDAFSFDASSEASLAGLETSESLAFEEEFNPASAFPEKDTFTTPETTPAALEVDDTDFAPALPDTDFSFTASASEPTTLDADSLFASDDTSSDFTWEGSESAAFATETEAASITEQKEPLADSDFDFSSFSFDDVTAPEPSDTKEPEETLNSETASIELSVEEEAPAPPVLNSRIPTEYPKLHRPADEETTPRPAARPSHPRARQRKKASPLFAFKLIFGIFFVAALVFGLINREKIQNGYRDLVSRYIENQIPAEKAGQIGLNKLTGGYLSSSQGGDLFIIRGEAVNEYAGLRSSIMVRGTIYGADGTILQSQTAYCGNPLTDGKLKKMAFKEILEAMSNELGENLSNLNITPGKAVPFTIVFRGAPKNIAEYTVEVLDSKPGSK